MIILPVWAAALLVGLLPIVGLACYWYGWKLRDGIGPKIARRTETSSRPMTLAEQAKFNEAFEHMDRAFDAMRDLAK